MNFRISPAGAGPTARHARRAAATADSAGATTGGGISRATTARGRATVLDRATSRRAVRMI